MRLNAPRKGLWIFSTILAMAAILAYFIDPAVLGVNTAFWVMTASWLILFLASYFKGY